MLITHTKSTLEKSEKENLRFMFRWTSIAGIKSVISIFTAVALMPGVFVSIHVSAQKTNMSCVGDSITYGLSNPSGESYPGFKTRPLKA